MKRLYKYMIIICAALAVITAAARAGVAELVPKLSSEDMTVRYQAQLDLLKAGSNAGRPGADAERKALCEEMCKLVSGECPLPAA
ncbi:MAG: hypothetical protein K9M45_00605, partial [Kiritimatiellales bacterium]|nr:hypothetical protein [Kiritimatiellales bacterium]